MDDENFYDQDSEITVLQSIYEDELEVVRLEPQPIVRIFLKSEEFIPGNPKGFACMLTISLTAKYPQEVPIIEITDEHNFEGVLDKNEFVKFLNDEHRFGEGRGSMASFMAWRMKQFKRTDRVMKATKIAEMNFWTCLKLLIKLQIVPFLGSRKFKDWRIPVSDEAMVFAFFLKRHF